MGAIKGRPNQPEGERIVVPNGQTKYVEVPQASALVWGAHLWWTDATSNATITVETSNRSDVAIDSTTAGEWIAESSITVTGPTGVAAGGSMLHVANMGSARARLKMVAAANSTVFAKFHGKD